MSESRSVGTIPAWSESVYRPTGHEINLLRDVFGPLGKGSVVQFREALRLVREFSHAF